MGLRHPLAFRHFVVFVASWAFPLPSPLPHFELATVPAEQEDQIVLMGYPNNGVAVSSSIEKGAVTGHYTRFGQARHLITCTIYQGNSGGPLLDRNFRLVGIAANGIAKEEPKPANLHGVIPISVLADFLQQYSGVTG